MNRSTVMTIIRYCIVIMLLALILFFWLDVTDPGFVAVCITMALCLICFLFGLMLLLHNEEKGLEKKRAVIAICAGTAVCVIAAVIKWALVRA